MVFSVSFVQNNVRKNVNQIWLGEKIGVYLTEYGPEGMYFHSNCKMKLFNKRSLEQAKKRKEKEQAEREKEEKQTKMIVKIENEAGLKP